MTRTFSRKSGSGLWSHRRMRWGRKSSARRMRPISLWLMRQPVFRLRHSPSEVYVQMSRSAISGGWSHAIIISSQRISTGIDSGRPLRWLSSRAARVLHAAKRLRHLRTVFSVMPRARAISALLCPAAAASTMLARSTRRRGAVALRANLSNLARIGGAMWILEAIERLICPLRFAGDHDIQTRYELSAGGTRTVIGSTVRAGREEEPMSVPSWNPPRELSRREQTLLKRRTKKLFGFLRQYRHELFDEGFQKELASMYRERGEGKEPVAPALLAMVTLLQAYTGASDAEAVDLSMDNARWQMVLGVLGEEEAPFSQGVLSPFRDRLIAHEMDRRLLERTVELARRTGGFDPKKLPKTLRLAVDSRPLIGAGRVEDTFNLLGRAARQLLTCAAKVKGEEPKQIAERIGAELLLGRSIKSALDIADWTNEAQKSAALSRLLTAIAALEEWVREELGERAGEPPVAEKLATLGQLREQDLDPEPPGGGKAQIREGVAPDRRVSLGDPEMRHGRKSKSRTFSGYKSHLATDLDQKLVLACAVTPANRPEGEGLDSMKNDLARVIPHPIEELHVDRAYVGAEHTHELIAQGTELISKARGIAANDGYFDKSDFKIDLRAGTATCPAGQSIPVTLGQVARFNPEICAACPLRVICTSSALGRGRTLSIAADEPLQRRLRNLSASRSGRAAQRQRVAIEHRLAHHAQKQGRFARYRGLRKNLLDSRRHAAILNLEVLHARRAA